MKQMLRRASTAVARSWCQTMHPDPMWPINGMYQCPKCLRRYQVPWEHKPGNGHLEHARLVTPAEAARMTHSAAQPLGLTALPPAA